MDDRLDKDIFKRDEETIRRVNEIEEEMKKREAEGDLSEREKEHYQRRIDKILKDAKEKDEADAVRERSYEQRENAYEANRIERRDEHETERARRQTEFLDEREKIDEKFVHLLDEHDQKKLARLQAKTDLDEHDKKEIQKLKDKIKERDQHLSEKEERLENDLAQKQADQIIDTLEKDEKNAQKMVD